MKRIPFFLILWMMGSFWSCAQVPITGRKQFKLLPNSTLNNMALTQYKEFLSTHTLSTNATQRDMVTRVGTAIQKAAENYFTMVNKKKYLEGYRWEFNLVEDPTVNAWCMPGGKVVVYTGLLSVANNEDALAIVMGHEIAHALAQHGNERMSQQLATQMGGVALSVALSSRPAETRDLFLNAYGAGAQVGALLPFSRLHESEADEIGLILAACAGYDPAEGPKLWERMEKLGGPTPPAILSTHPSHNKRIEHLTELQPKARAYAIKYGIKK